MNEQIEVLELEKSSLQIQLATVEVAFEKFKSDPEMTYEATKAGKDMQTLKGRIQEVEEKIQALSESPSRADIQNDYPTRAGIVIELSASTENSQINWRFAPDDSPEELRRLTTLPLQAGQPLEGGEIDLMPFAGQKLKVQGSYHDSVWICQAKIM